MEEGSVPLHLLHPQRDLVANWAVDVANELQAYVEQLARVFSDGNLCNFAEAALVIQGSIQVYSRKVEHLYNLVLQALEHIAHKQKLGQDKSSVQGDGRDADVCEEEEKEEEFLSLDDIPEEPNIDIDDFGNGASLRSPALKPPACLLVVEGDARDCAGEAGELASYQIVTSTLHRDFLLLDPCDAETVDKYLGGTGLNHGAEKKSSPLGARSRTPRGNLSTPGKRQGSAVKARTPKSGGAVPIHEDDKAADTGSKGYRDLPPWPEQANTVNGEWPVNSLEHMYDDNGHGGASSGEDETESNPWVQLNPHEMGSLPIKPYKKGPHFRKEKSGKKRGAGSTGEMSVATRSGLLFPELGKLLQHENESTRSTDPYVQRYEELRATFIVRDSTATKSPTKDNLSDDDSGAPDAYDVDDGPGDGFDAFNVDDVGEVGAPAFMGGRSPPVDDVGEGGAPGFMGGTGPPGFPECDAAPAVDSQDAEAHGMSFEELCQAHVDSIFSKLAHFEERTELATRVSTWKQKIETTLDEQESRTQFDIHLYGEKLLHDLSTSSDGSDMPVPDRPFTHLVQGQDVHEVARAFSALLQLVNNGNVTIQTIGTQEGSAKCYTAEDCFSVTMLTTRKQHEELLRYMAPSRMESNKSKVKKGKGNSSSGRTVLHDISNLASPTPASPLPASLGKRRHRQSPSKSQRRPLSQPSTSPPSRRKRPPLPPLTPVGLR